MNKVTVSEATRIRAAKWLREKSYITTAIGGDSDPTQLVVVNKVIQEPKKFLFLKWFVATEYTVARLWIKLVQIGAGKDNWIIHVYGEENMDEFIELAKDLAETFNVKVVHVRLEEEKAKEQPEYHSPY